METTFTYDHHSTITTSPGEASLDFAANVGRAPVSFRGLVREPFLLRQLLFALHRVVIGDFRWLDQMEWESQVLDPVITVHPDQVFFEAFSADESCYARLSTPLTAFEPQGETSYGTTNIDFTSQLRDALESMRSSQNTVFAVGAQGFGVQTTGTRETSHFERKVDLPEGWLKGFLQVQSAFTMHPFLFDVKPTDLLSVIAFFQDNKPPGPPHGLRFEFKPGEPIRAVLEPWGKEFVLRDTEYKGYARTVRLWGRRRLELLQHVLPYADKVTVGVLGRGLPHFYVCKCGDCQFTLALSGWTSNDWSKGSAFELLAPRGRADDQVAQAVYGRLSEDLFGMRTQLAAEGQFERAQVEHALFELCRAGRVMFDPTTGMYRLRELFAEPLDYEELFPPDARLETAEGMVEEGSVELTNVVAPDAPENWRREHQADAVVSAEDDYEVYVAVDTEGRLRFGRCECQFFKDNIMSRGPCEHILAARLALDKHLGSVQQENLTEEEKLDD